MQPLEKKRRFEVLPEFDEYIRRWPVKIDGKSLKAVVETYFPKKRSECVVFGRKCVVPRDEVMFTRKPDQETYTYSNHEVPLKHYTAEIECLRQQANLIASTVMQRPVDFVQVLLNGYSRNGRDGVGWHRDDESTIDQTFPIVSFSFGDTRDFIVRRDADGEKQTFPLLDGDVVVMMPGTQQKFMHSVPRRAGNGQRRYNLTFRVYKKKIV